MDGQAIPMPVAVDEPPENAASRVGALFDVHHQRLFKLARRLSRNAEDARDLVQETFLRAARSPRSIPEGAPNEEAWLVRVLINICRDRWRHSAVRVRAGSITVSLPPRLRRARSLPGKSAAVAKLPLDTRGFAPMTTR